MEIEKSPVLKNYSEQQCAWQNNSQREQRYLQLKQFQVLMYLIKAVKCL